MEPARGSAASTTVTGGIRTWLAGWGLKEWRRAGLVAVLVATAAFGGLDTVNKQVTQLTAGEAFDNGRFEMTVLGASLIDEVRAGPRVLFSAKPGRRYLGLVVRAHNTSTRPGNLSNAIALGGQLDASFLSSFRFADGTVSVRLGAGLTDEIVLLWELADDELAVGAELPVRIWKEVPKTSVTFSQGWVRSLTDYGILDVTVKGPQ